MSDSSQKFQPRKVSIRQIIEQGLLNKGTLDGWLGRIENVSYARDDKNGLINHDWRIDYANGGAKYSAEPDEERYDFTPYPLSGDAFYLSGPREVSRHEILTHKLLDKGTVWWDKTKTEQVEYFGASGDAYLVGQPGFNRGRGVNFYYRGFWFEPFTGAEVVDSPNSPMFVTAEKAFNSKLLNKGKLYENMNAKPDEQVIELKDNHCMFASGKGYANLRDVDFWFVPNNADTYKQPVYVTVAEAREHHLMKHGRLIDRYGGKPVVKFVQPFGAGVRDEVWMHYANGNKTQLKHGADSLTWLLFEPYPDKPQPPATPECDRLAEVHENVVGLVDFMDWLSDNENLHFAQWDEGVFSPYCVRVTVNRQDLAYRFLGIDAALLETERRALLQYVRDLADWEARRNESGT